MPPGTFSLLIRAVTASRKVFFALAALAGLAALTAFRPSPGLAVETAGSAGARPPAAAPAQRAAHPGIAKTEALVRDLEDRLKVQEVRLAALNAEILRLARERKALEEESAEVTARLRDMLPRLWAMDVRFKGMVAASVVPWDETDRNLTWLGAAYGLARGDLDRLLRKRDELAANRAREAGLKMEAAAQAAQIEKTRGDLAAARQTLRPELPDPTRRSSSPGGR